MKRFFYVKPMIRPPLLRKGDRVAIVASAKRLQSGIDKGISLLKDWGLEIVIGDHVHDKANLFAGRDEDRLMDLQMVFDDSTIKAVFMARGGYGTTRILDQIDLTSFLNDPKWVCGFSDITALLQNLVNHGIASLHSTVPVLMGQEEHQLSDDSLWRALFEGNLYYEFESSKLNRIGHASGVVCGGNLSMICNSMGTSSEIDTEGKILFIEDVGEYYYHLDRMLVHLRRAGKFDAVKGVLIGYFTHMKDHQDSFGLSVNQIILEQLKDFDFPVAFGFRAGHEAPNLPLYFGVNAALSVDSDRVILDYKTSGQSN